MRKDEHTFPRSWSVSLKDLRAVQKGEESVILHRKGWPVAEAGRSDLAQTEEPGTVEKGTLQPTPGDVGPAELLLPLVVWFAKTTGSMPCMPPRAAPPAVENAQRLFEIGDALRTLEMKPRGKRSTEPPVRPCSGDGSVVFGDPDMAKET